MPAPRKTRKPAAKKPRTPTARKPRPRPARPASDLPSVRPEPERVARILDELERLYPEATCELHWHTPFELLVATILSAQCTDARVNEVSPEVFRRWPDAAALAKAPRASLEKVIHSTGFFRNKAKSLIGMSKKLVALHRGQVPRGMAEMIELPGVARKTANVVLGTAYGLATGVVVDTHVQRLAARLGLSLAADPVRIERELMAVVPEDRWVKFSQQLVWHGRRVCEARKPACARCPLPCPSRQEPTV